MTLGDAIASSVEFNHAVGMRFQVDAALLKAFHRHAGAVDLAAITLEVVLAFLQPRHRVTSTWHMKHRAVRRFYQYAITRGLVARSPVPTAVPRVTETFVPHIYSDEELRRLLAGVQAHQTRDARCTIAAPTFRAFLLLLYSTGLRLGEALGLRREDVDLRAGMILIRDGKFHKSRHLPIGPRLTHALAEYIDTAPAWRGPAPTAFFVNRCGGRMPHQTVWWNFASLRARVGVQGRVHDLRHTFAVHRLLAWYREGADVQRCLPYLSTYLGHARIACTQRYLTMPPELLEQASRRFETYAQSEVRHE